MGPTYDDPNRSDIIKWAHSEYHVLLAAVGMQRSDGNRRAPRAGAHDTPTTYVRTLETPRPPNSLLSVRLFVPLSSDCLTHLSEDDPFSILLSLSKLEE